MQERKQRASSHQRLDVAVHVAHAVDVLVASRALFRDAQRRQLVEGTLLLAVEVEDRAAVAHLRSDHPRYSPQPLSHSTAVCDPGQGRATEGKKKMESDEEQQLEGGLASVRSSMWPLSSEVLAPSM